MSKFAKWAQRSTRGIVPTIAAPSSPPPSAPTVIVPGRNPPQMRQVMTPGGPARLVVTGRPAIYRPAPMPTQHGSRDTCMLVKVEQNGRDGYGDLLDALPDIAPQDMSGGADAMRMAGAPPGVVLNKWTPTARYYNGVNDATAAGGIDGHVASRFGENRSAMHQSQPSNIRVGQSDIG